LSRRESGSDSGPDAGDAGKCTSKFNYQDNAWPNLGAKFDPAADAAVSGIILLRSCSQKRVAHIQITNGRGDYITSMLHLLYLYVVVDTDIQTAPALQGLCVHSPLEQSSISCCIAHKYGYNKGVTGVCCRLAILISACLTEGS
jgi:hypothetical protein